MNAVSPPPAGWYPDPSGRFPFRYWDGARWTEHTDQGTAPSPPVAPFVPAPPQPAAPLAYAPSSNPGVPASPAAAHWNAQSFLADLKKFDGFALVVVAAVVFFAASFLSWTSAPVAGIDATGAQVSQSESSNAWESNGAWLIRGWAISDLVSAPPGTTPDSGSDMVILLPIALVAAGVAAASRLGKRITNVNEIVLGASGVLALLMVAQAVHLSGAIDELGDILQQRGATFSGNLDMGLYLAIVASLVMTGGALKTLLAARRAVA